jgi:hypothetical protein
MERLEWLEAATLGEARVAMLETVEAGEARPGWSCRRN